MRDYNSKKRNKVIGAATVALLLVVYIAFQSRSLISGPSLVIKTPKNGEHVNENLVTIKGQAQKIAYISLNGRQIYVDDLGLFEEKVLLSNGYNIISVEAKDKFGRSKEETIKVVYSETPDGEATASAGESSLP